MRMTWQAIAGDLSVCGQCVSMALLSPNLMRCARAGTLVVQSANSPGNGESHGTLGATGNHLCINGGTSSRAAYLGTLVRRPWCLSPQLGSTWSSTQSCNLTTYGTETISYDITKLASTRPVQRPASQFWCLAGYDYPCMVPSASRYRNGTFGSGLARCIW